MASIEVNLSDFNNDDIIEYVIDNIDSFRPRHIEKLADAMDYEPPHEFDFIDMDNLADTMKLEFIAEIWKKYTLEQLEEKLK